MKNKIRSLKKEDLPQLLPLFDQFGYPTNIIELEARYERFTSIEGYGIAICEINNKIVGFIAWSKSLFFAFDKVRYHIEALIIDENYRKRGIGKDLMFYVENQAKGNAVIDLTSGVRRAEDGTHDFYKAIGYKNEGPMAKIYLRKDIKASSYE